MSQKEEEAKQRLLNKFYDSISKAKCQTCGSTLIEKSIIFEGELICTNCNTPHYLWCPRCKKRISAEVLTETTGYRCPSCGLEFRAR
jgi:DNA-directed RNA polymerase subunit RPC12/RpoP